MGAIVNIGFLATCASGSSQDDVKPHEDAAVGWRDGRIDWIGPDHDLPDIYRDETPIDAEGRLVVPGLVDCHTHLGFGGWRAEEFEQRLRGTSYLEIAAAGGGIQSTVSQTRSASQADIEHRSLGFLDAMIKLGVTTVEAKSGYGLDFETEIRQLKAYRAIADRTPARLVSTFLAHMVPGPFQDRRDAFVELLTDQVLPAVATENLAVFCDVFVEESAFSIDEARRIFAAASGYGFIPKLHADQLTDSGGALLAAEVGAVSADHLECISEDGIAAMAAAGTVAVSLPLASLYLNAQPLPARALLASGVPVAVATDFNPGSAPSFHLPLAMTLACVMQRMTPNEALNGATRIAAAAIGLEKEVGSIEVGKSADFAIVNADSPAQWLYHFQSNAVENTILKGHAYSG